MVEMWRTTECDWEDVDSTNRGQLGVGGGHSMQACLDACHSSATCHFAARSPPGYCHLFATCDGDGGGEWTVYETQQTRVTPPLSDSLWYLRVI
jgi:hypothetical protein